MHIQIKMLKKKERAITHGGTCDVGRLLLNIHRLHAPPVLCLHYQRAFILEVHQSSIIPDSVTDLYTDFMCCFPSFDYDLYSRIVCTFCIGLYYTVAVLTHMLQRHPMKAAD